MLLLDRYDCIGVLSRNVVGYPLGACQVAFVADVRCHIHRTYCADCLDFHSFDIVLDYALQFANA